MSQLMLKSPVSFTASGAWNLMVSRLDMVQQNEGVCDDAEILCQRKNAVASYNASMEWQERLQEKEKAFFAKRGPLQKEIKEEAIPLLISIYDGQEDLFMARLKDSNPKLYAMLISDYQEDEARFEIKLSHRQKFCVAQRLFNEILAGAETMIVRVSDYSENAHNTLGIARILERQSWAIAKDYDIEFCEIEILFPFLRNSPLGTFDRVIGSWVDLSACYARAYELFAQREGRIYFPSTELGAKCAARYESVDSLSQAMAHNALYEEVKHQINFYRRVVAPGREDFHANKIKFFHERLLPNTHFKLSSHAPEGVQLDCAECLEEVNAKLTAIAFSPDPHLELAINDSLLQVQLMHRDPSIIPIGMILAGMMRDVDATTLDQNGLRDMMSLDKRVLRKMAFTALQRTFREDFNNLPFCALDENGNLVEKSNTHPFFYQWQKK